MMEKVQRCGVEGRKERRLGFLKRRDGKAEAAWTQGKGREKIRVSSLP
jgi:hypothetical protein